MPSGSCLSTFHNTYWLFRYSSSRLKIFTPPSMSNIHCGHRQQGTLMMAALRILHKYISLLVYVLAFPGNFFSRLKIFTPPLMNGHRHTQDGCPQILLKYISLLYVLTFPSIFFYNFKISNTCYFLSEK